MTQADFIFERQRFDRPRTLSMCVEELRSGSEVALELPQGCGTVAARPNTLTLEQQITALFEQLRDAIYRYVLATCHDPAEAEEITQDSFLRLHLHLKEGRSVENAKAWLFRVAHNLAIDRQKAQRRTTHSDSDLEPILEARPDTALNPEDALLRKELLGSLHRAISGLARQQQQCLHLRAEGLRYREIADVLGISDSTVSECLRRGLSRLIKDLNE